MTSIVSIRLSPGSVACALLLVLGFAIRGSDTPQMSLLMVMVFAAFCALIFIKAPAAEGYVPARAGVLFWPAVACMILVLGLLCLPARHFLPQFTRLPGLFDPSEFALEMLKLAGLAVALLAGFRLSRNQESARRLFDAIILAGSLWAMACIIMFILDPNGIYGVLKTTPGRLTGALCSANSAATLFGTLSILSLARLISRYRASTARMALERIDPVFVLAIVANLVALALTLSRMGILATLIGLLGTWLVLSDKKGRLSGAFMVFALAAGAGIVVFGSQLDQILDRLTVVHADGITRQTIYAAHLQAAMKHPLLGYGLGAFVSVNNAILTPENYTALWQVRTAHNVYLQWFEETGIVGLGSLVLLNVTLLVPLVRGAFAGHRLSSRIWGILLVYVVFLIHGLTDFAFQEIALTLYLSVLLGSGLAMAESVRHDGKVN